MTKYLGWVAVGGIAVGVIASALAANFGGHDAFGMNIHDNIRDFVSFADSCGDNEDDDRTGPGQTERHLPWDGGDTVNIALHGTVHFRGGEGDDVVVRGSPREVARVHVDGSNIHGGHCSSGDHKIDVTLPGRAFRNINLSGAGIIVLENVQQPSLDIQVSGSGLVSAQGTSDEVRMNISGAGSVDLSKLAVKRLDLHISGAGNAEAAPKDDANVSISGAGYVKLLTRPTHLDSHVSGIGRVSQPPETTAQIN